jgi:phosphatidylserine/phosphatidylglycerophosphate/cardiolipin synthase-like enzyme
VGTATRKILAPGRNLWRLARADASGVIIDAADYFRAFHAAATRARRSILISGWQFDRGVQLLRGQDAVGRGDVRLVKFLNGLCERTPSLHVDLLAWDFHVVFALEREWMQRLWFHYATNPRMRFRFDDLAADGGSHHQKLVVIDGELAFLGGIDLCEARWDDRRHATRNPLRTSRGRWSRPYHDVQAYVVGREVCGALRDLFRERWARSGGTPLRPEDAMAHDEPSSVFLSVPHITLGPGTVALSRTDPRAQTETIVELEHLILDALSAAERLIFIENQYVSSTRIRDALVARMHERDRPGLEIVLLVNPRAEAFKEEIAVGLRQAKNLEVLRQAAVETGHALGIHYSLSDGAGDGQRATYIHSKLLIIDDRFLTIGSANLTNRSLAVDSELDVSWEAGAEDRALVRRIRRLRVSLLAEHAGLAGVAAVRALVPIPGLVARLAALAARPEGRLRAYRGPSPSQKAMMKIVDPERLPFDPATPAHAGGAASRLAEDHGG